MFFCLLNSGLEDFPGTQRAIPSSTTHLLWQLGHEAWYVLFLVYLDKAVISGVFPPHSISLVFLYLIRLVECLLWEQEGLIKAPASAPNLSRSHLYQGSVFVGWVDCQYIVQVTWNHSCLNTDYFALTQGYIISLLTLTHTKHTHLLFGSCPTSVVPTIIEVIPIAARVKLQKETWKQSSFVYFNTTSPSKWKGLAKVSYPADPLHSQF